MPDKKNYEIGGRKIVIKNTDKIFFPKEGISKGDLIEYYRKISPYMIPHIKNRPLNLKRAPDGVEGESFYQQNAPDYFPEWIDKVTVERHNDKEDEGRITHVLCNNKESLVYLAGQAVVVFHAWVSCAPHYRKPDKVVFDLDPPSGENFKKVVEASLLVKDFFEKFNIKTFPMLSGSRGIHVVISVEPVADIDKVHLWAKKLAINIEKKHPNYFTTAHRKAKRQGKILIDWFRSSYGQTSVVPYSVRLKPMAPVAVPLSWEEIERGAGLGPRDYTIKNIFKRMGQIDDPWSDFDKFRTAGEELAGVLED